MKLLEAIASWAAGIGDWIVTALQKTPSFTAMYLLVIYGMHDSILELMTSGWCENSEGADCGAGLICFSAMAFLALCVTVAADYNRLEKTNAGR